MPPNPYASDQQLLEALRNHQETAWKFLYRALMPSVINYIRKNRGQTKGSDQDHAQELIQNMIFTLFRRLSEEKTILLAEKFTLKPGGSLIGYLYKACCNDWLQVLEGNRRLTDLDEEVTENLLEQSTPQQMLEKEQLDAAIRVAFQKLDAKCRILLDGYWKEKKVNELSQLAGYTGNNTTFNALSRCKGKLAIQILIDQKQGFCGKLLYARYGSEKSVKEIAKELNITDHTDLEAQLSECMANLKKILKDLF